MFKATPNPPVNDSVPYDAALEAQNLKAAQKRAINFYLASGPTTRSTPSGKPRRIFMIDPTTDDETLLLEACESLASASDMARDIATTADGSQRTAMLTLQRVIMLSELVVNRVLDNYRIPR